MPKTPSQVVSDRFGDKSKLVEAVKQFVNDDLWVSRENKSKGLAHVSNAKLLRLHETFTAVHSKWGTRARLIDAILDLEKKPKDQGYRARLEAWPVPRLYDYYRSASKRSNPTKAPPKTRVAAKPTEASAPAKGAKATAAAAKKVAAKGSPAKKRG